MYTLISMDLTKKERKFLQNMLQKLKMAYVNDHPSVQPFTEIFHVVYLFIHRFEIGGLRISCAIKYGLSGIFPPFFFFVFILLSFF